MGNVLTLLEPVVDADARQPVGLTASHLQPLVWSLTSLARFDPTQRNLGRLSNVVVDRRVNRTLTDGIKDLQGRALSVFHFLHPVSSVSFQYLFTHRTRLILSVPLYFAVICRNVIVTSLWRLLFVNLHSRDFDVLYYTLDRWPCLLIVNAGAKNLNLCSRAVRRDHTTVQLTWAMAYLWVLPLGLCIPRLIYFTVSLFSSHAPTVSEINDLSACFSSGR